MTEERETWLNDVNDDFQGKLNEDPPREFFAIMASHCKEIIGVDGEHNTDEEDEDEDDGAWDEMED